MSVALFVALALSGYSLIRVSGGSEAIGTLDPSTTEDVAPSAATDDREPGPAGFLGRSLAPLLELMESDPDRLNRIFTDRLAKSIVVLVPIFALLLRGLFRDRSYVEHLVLSLHVHSFAFLAVLVGLGLDVLLHSTAQQRPGNGLAVLAIVVSNFVALRRVTGQGRLRVAGKMVVLAIAYLFALVVTMMATLALTAVTL
jgi:hypothetical protein